MMLFFFKLINSSFKRNLKVYIPYLISMTMLVAINYIFKAVEINRSLKDLPSAAVTKALMQTGSTFIILVTLAFYDLCQSLLMATASTRNGSL